jgi:hypothetical protein
MKAPGLRQLLSHAGVLAVGAVIAWLLRDSQPLQSSRPATGGSKSSDLPVVSSRSSIGSSDAASRTGRAVPDFVAAWAALSSLPVEERDLVRWRLLKDWIAEDPDAALEALVALEASEQVGLLECFVPLFEANPEWFLPILQTHRHGLRGVTVRDWWAERMAAADPARLVELARSFGPLDSASMMSKAMAGATLDQETMNSVFAALQEMPAGDETTRLWKAAGKGLAGIGTDLLEERYLEATHPEVKALFGQALAKALSDQELSPEQRAEILARIPADRRISLALDLAREAGQNSKAITAAIDSVIASPDWAQNAKRLASQLHNSLPRGADAVRLATWAATIPAREDTEDLYRTAVRSYLQQRPVAEIREWMTTMPPGWRRDNTLAAWVQSNANFGKLDEARWALERIQSPHFRSEGEKWITNAQARAK